jgi:hypothetical protein
VEQDKYVQMPLLTSKDLLKRELPWEEKIVEVAVVA